MRLIFARGDFCAIPCQQQMRSLTWNKTFFNMLFHNSKIVTCLQTGPKGGFLLYCSRAVLQYTVQLEFMWRSRGATRCEMCWESKEEGVNCWKRRLQWWRRLDDVQGLYVLPKCCFCCWLLCTWEKEEKIEYWTWNPPSFKKLCLATGQISKIYFGQ